MLDGFIARLTNSATDFGLQLDSLADVISFGIAPSVLALVWGLSVLDWRLAWTAAFTFAICGATRLARFNIQAGDFKHFVGLPIPAGGGIIAAIVHFFQKPIDSTFGAVFMVVCVFMVSFLMVSTIRYRSLKQFTLGKKSHLMILVLALLVALIYNYSRPALLTLATVYGISGPIARLDSYLRRKKHGDSLAPASHRIP
jgi:CDP-diacylglycerol--serine O-phosphatidyltransferase